MHAADVADVASAALANVVVANVAIFAIRPARGADADAPRAQASITAVFTSALSCASSLLVSLASRMRSQHKHGFDRVRRRLRASPPSRLRRVARRVVRTHRRTLVRSRADSRDSRERARRRPPRRHDVAV